MKTANIGELKNKLSQFINLVEKGEIVEIRKRNIPIAKIVPHDTIKPRKRTKLGCGKGTVEILADLTEPLIPEKYWDMLSR
jgi:prevent-host-death family protein